jgi:hypothetical protein
MLLASTKPKPSPKSIMHPSAIPSELRLPKPINAGMRKAIPNALT